MKAQLWCLIVAIGPLGGCAVAPLSEQVFGVKLPLMEQIETTNSAQIIFSADRKYESNDGVPIKGEPVVCQDGELRTTIKFKDNTAHEVNRIHVPSGEEVLLTSIISWVNAGITKTCWPFVSFVPESGAEYVVVNERVGGKGIAALWTGAAFQKCEVSVFHIDENSVRRIQVEAANPSDCSLD